MAAPGTTPAGGQINSDWEPLRRGIQCLALFLSTATKPSQREWHVVFRCGTVVRLDGTESEFAGYTPHTYVFPDHRVEDEGVVRDVMDDNRRVWEAQRAIPDPAGTAIRLAYTRLVAQGYPYSGTPQANRSARPTGVETEADGLMWIVYWPGLDCTGRVSNLAFAGDIKGAVESAGNNRRLDYMYPEAAAVIDHELNVWSYKPGGAFSCGPDPDP